MDPAQGTGATSRRQVLRWIAFSALGAGVLLTTGRLVAASPARSNGAPAQPSTTPPRTSSSNASPAPLRVKVMYFQMPLAVGTKQEYFVLEGPAHFSDLMNEILAKHPSLSPMMPSMLVLIDGLRALPGTQLRDRDEVDFIPASPGG